MKKAKKAKASQRRSELDRIVTRLRAMLRRETTSVIEIGTLLIESRKHLEHGEWQPWLAENFDLGYRTAINYVNAAEYVARKGKSESISHFANLSASVLYELAAGHFDERVEASILAEAKAAKRVDEDTAWAIRDALAPPDDDDPKEDDDDEDGTEDGGENATPAEDPESAAILDGPPPAVPPPAPNQAPPDFDLRDFDGAVSTLKRLMTKPSAQFGETIHSADDLESIESFIRMVRQQGREQTGAQAQ